MSAEIGGYQGEYDGPNGPDYTPEFVEHESTATSSQG